MVLTVLYAFFTVFCILGICDLIFFIKMFFVSPENTEGDYILVLLKSNDYKLQIYSTVQKKNWYGKSYCKSILAYTGDLKPEEKDDCIKSFSLSSVYFFDSISDIENLEPFTEG